MGKGRGWQYEVYRNKTELVLNTKRTYSVLDEDILEHAPLCQITFTCLRPSPEYITPSACVPCTEYALWFWRKQLLQMILKNIHTETIGE